MAAFFRALKWALPFIKVIGIVSIAIFLSYESSGFLSSVPTPKTVEDFPLPKKIRVYDRNHTILYEAYGYSSYRIPQYTFSKKVLDIFTPKTLSNPLLSKAIAENYFLFKKGDSFQGIKTYVMAVKLFFSTNREDLSELYLNSSLFGRDAIGIEAASRMFFGKKTSELSSAELVFLSGFLDSHSPRSIRPLYGIYKRAPFAVDCVLKTIRETQGETFFFSKDLSVYTTIDATAQSKFQQRYFDLEGVGFKHQEFICISNVGGETIAVVGPQPSYSNTATCAYSISEQEFEKKTFPENALLKREDKPMSRLISKIVNENVR